MSVPAHSSHPCRVETPAPCAAHPGIPEPSRLADLDGGGQLILVLDDDAEIRTVMRAALMALNFRVIASGDGMLALHQAAETRHPLAAIITDLHMPEMCGVTFVDLLRRMLPEARVIVTSGNFNESALQQFRALRVDAMLPKPFNRAQLTAVLRSVLQK